MRKPLTALTLLLAFSMGQGALLACGDKFFLVGRGDRFSRAYASLHPGNIVIYAGGATATSKALGDGRLQKYFAKAGHRVTIARDSAALARALGSGSVDVVLAGMTEAINLVPNVDSVASKPTLMPVEDEKEGATVTRHQFAATLKASDKINGFLAKIEGVMKTRSSTTARARS
jgi:hypothetical protein